MPKDKKNKIRHGANAANGGSNRPALDRVREIVNQKRQANAANIVRSPQENEDLEERMGAGRRRGIFYRFVRNRVAAVLEQQGGYTAEQAAEVANGVSEAEIDDHAEKHGVKDIGDGGFLQWLKDHKEQIFNLIMSIVSLLSMFAAPKLAGHTATAPKEERKDEEKKEVSAPEAAPETPRPTAPAVTGGKGGKPREGGGSPRAGGSES